MGSIVFYIVICLFRLCCKKYICKNDNCKKKFNINNCISKIKKCLKCNNKKYKTSLQEGSVELSEILKKHSDCLNQNIINKEVRYTCKHCSHICSVYIEEIDTSKIKTKNKKGDQPKRIAPILN